MTSTIDQLRAQRTRFPRDSHALPPSRTLSGGAWGEVRLSPSLAGTPAREAARECQEQDSQEAKHRLESAELGARWEAM